MKLIDLSLTIDNCCMTCGTPWHQEVAVERMGTVADVGRNTSRLLLGSHTATHMDAPLHFFEEGYGIDGIDLSDCVGAVSCVDFTGKKAGETVTLEDVRKLEVTQRMLFAFGWHRNWKTPRYYKQFPYFSVEAVRSLLERGMRFMALDTPSPDDGSAIQKVGGEGDSPNHKLLLSHGVVLVEYLTHTDEIDFGKNHKIIALPLKLKGVDGSPARVVLEEE